MSDAQQEILSRAGHAVRRVRGVAAAWVFGSAAAGRLRKDSDVDLALLFHPQALPDAAARFALRDELTSLLGREVDLIVVNGASPVLRMQVLRHGVRVATVAPRETVSFIVRTLGEYDDLKRVRRPIERALLRGRVFDG